MPTLIIRSNSETVANILVRDMGFLVPFGGAIETLTDIVDIKDAETSADLRSLCTDLLFEGGPSASDHTLILNDGTNDIAPEDVDYFLETLDTRQGASDSGLDLYATTIGYVAGTQRLQNVIRSDGSTADVTYLPNGDVDTITKSSKGTIIILTAVYSGNKLIGFTSSTPPSGPTAKFYHLPFYCRAGMSVGDYLGSGNNNENPSSADPRNVSHSVAASGILDSISFLRTTASRGIVLDILVEPGGLGGGFVSQGTATFTGSEVTISVSIPLVKEDLVQFRITSIVDGDPGEFFLWPSVTPTEDGILYLPFAGSLGAGDYIHAGHISNFSAPSSIGVNTEMTVPAGTLKSLLVHGAGQITGATFEVWINGVLNQTTGALTQNEEILLAETVLVDGDELVLRTDTTLSQTYCIVRYAPTDPAYEALAIFAGDANIPRFLRAVGSANGTTDVAIGVFNETFIPKASRILALSYHVQVTAANPVWTPQLNGAPGSVPYTKIVNEPSGILKADGDTFAAGDSLALEVATADPNDQTIIAWIGAT